MAELGCYLLTKALMSTVTLLQSGTSEIPDLICVGLAPTGRAHGSSSRPKGDNIRRRPDPLRGLRKVIDPTKSRGDTKATA